MTFLAWLRKQRHRDDQVGDLAQDTFRMKKHPFNAGLKEWQNYLLAHGACIDAQESLKAAWKEYSATLPK